MRPLLVALLLAAAPLAFAPPARAQSELADVAKKQFKEAQKLYDQRDFEGALPLFEQVWETLPSPNAKLYVARCLRELGRLPEAYEAFTVALHEASAKAETEPRFAGTRDAAAAEKAGLEPKIGRLSIALDERPLGLVVELDGKVLGPSRLGPILALSPGAHRVAARAPGFERFEREVRLAGGESSTIAVVLRPVAKAPLEPEEPAAAAPPVTEPPQAETKPKPAERPPVAAQGPTRPEVPDHTLRWVGVGALGLGVAGLTTFAVAGLGAQSKFDELSAKCGGERCTDPADAATVDEGRQLDLFANVGLIAGSALVVLGSAMIIVDSAGSRGREGATLDVGPEHAWLGYRGQF
jgi:hypothetical protein